MRKNISKMSLFGIIFTMMLGLSAISCAYADEDTKENDTQSNVGGTSISLTPVSKILQISSDSVYEDEFTVSNDGDGEMKIEVYAAPYSYTYSSEEDIYELGFVTENNFTQISRWITFQNSDGVYEEKPKFTIQPHDSVTVHYKITTPKNISAGGQYAVMFAHTLTSEVSANGIRTEASPGIVVYGRSTEGEAVTSAEITDLRIEQGHSENGATNNNLRASAKVRNTGNMDFNASGVLKVEPIIGGASYETAMTDGRISVIPESQLVVLDEWEETPGFGIYKVTWSVTVGEETETIERIIFINPLPFIIVMILVLTIIIVCIIIFIKKRKERRSRLAI